MKNLPDQLFPLSKKKRVYAPRYADQEGYTDPTDHELLRLFREWEDPRFFAAYYRKHRKLFDKQFFDKPFRKKSPEEWHIAFVQEYLTKLARAFRADSSQVLDGLFERYPNDAQRRNPKGKRGKKNKPSRLGKNQIETLRRRGNQRGRMRVKFAGQERKHGWLRLYAVKYNRSKYLITSGGIKPTGEIKKSPGLSRQYERCKMGIAALAKMVERRPVTAQDNKYAQPHGERWEKFLDNRLRHAERDARHFVVAFRVIAHLQKNRISIGTFASWLGRTEAETNNYLRGRHFLNPDIINDLQTVTGLKLHVHQSKRRNIALFGRVKQVLKRIFIWKR